MRLIAGTEAVVYRNQEMEFPEVRGFLGGEAAVFSSRCPGKPTSNEDAAALVPFTDDAGVLLVADGMGGHAAGAAASTCALQEMIAAIRDARESGQILRTGIIDGFERAHQAVQAQGTGGGTTLAAVELSDGMARPYHAGDSVILVVGAHGKVKLETVSHSPVAFAVEAGLLNEEEAMHHEDRHVVFNAVGIGAMKIEIGSPIRLAQRDTLLLASDGLTDNLTIPEIVGYIRKGRLEKSLAALVGESHARMNSPVAKPSKPDDLTVVTFRGGAAFSGRKRRG